MMWITSWLLLSATGFTSVRQAENCILQRRNCRFAHSVNGDSSLTESPSDATDNIVERKLRFAGVARLYQDKDTSVDTILDRLYSSTVAIIGLGGVGSWTAESLCRSGIGNIILVDLDDICVSNTNRQLHATSSNVGKMKIDVMKSRLLDINPRCNVTLLHEFVTMDSANSLLSSLLLHNNLTACIDAIDGMYEKTALLLACVHHGIPIVTCGGAAGRVDPTKVCVDDLTKVKEDRLLFKCRKLLRQEYGFPKVPIESSGSKVKAESRVRNWRIQAVYSTEVQQTMAITGVRLTEDETINDVVPSSSFRTCDGPMGTASFVTATYGLAAAWKVVEMIAMDQMVVPKKLIRRRQQHTESNNDLI